MRASSEVFVTFQRPDTIFGLPPRLAGLAASFAVVIFAVLSAAGLSAVGFIALVMSVIASLTFLWRRNRADPHFESLVMVAPHFWRRRKVRRILSGAPDRLPARKEFS